MSDIMATDESAGEPSQLRDIDLNLLVTLQVLLEEQSVTRAAARLHLGQPAVSGALGRLRALLDDDLLVRVGRSMRPTPRAEALLAPLTELLSDAEALLWPSEPFDPGSLRREVTIILGDYEEIVLLPAFARRLAAEAPGVTIRTRSLAADSRTALDRGDADLWITPFDQRWLDLPFETVLEDRWVGVGCARAWPAGGRSGERRPRPSLVVRSGPDGALPSGPTFRRHRFADPLDVEHVVSTLGRPAVPGGRNDPGRRDARTARPSARRQRRDPHPALVEDGPDPPSRAVAPAAHRRPVQHLGT